jgi:hypothetical protein
MLHLGSIVWLIYCTVFSTVPVELGVRIDEISSARESVNTRHFALPEVMNIGKPLHNNLTEVTQPWKIAKVKA